MRKFVKRTLLGAVPLLFVFGAVAVAAAVAAVLAYFVVSRNYYMLGFITLVSVIFVCHQIGKDVEHNLEDIELAKQRWREDSKGLFRKVDK